MLKIKKVAIMGKFKNAEDYVKPGMKVKLRKDLVAEQMYGSDCWITDMVKPGSEVVVERIIEDDKFYVKGSFYNYTVDMLENPIKLSDLFKVGDRVRLREDLKVGVMYGGLTYLNSMLKQGTETTIEERFTGTGNDTSLGRVFVHLQSCYARTCRRKAEHFGKTFSTAF